MSKKIQSPAPNHVYQFRSRHGLTQRELARAAHASVRTVQHWESGSRVCPASTWELLLIKAREIKAERIK